MNAQGLQALVAEDEAPQRESLCRELARMWPDLQLAAICSDGRQALAEALRLRPAVAFLDIRMPGVGGLEIARSVLEGGGQVVFTTAYDDYAIRAFEAGALDYLLKPIRPERLAQAISRVQQRLQSPPVDDLQARLRDLESRLSAPPAPIRWISASVGDSVRMIGIDEVLYFQAQEKYVRVVTAGFDALIRTPLKSVLAGLDPDAFWQVHRSVVVRVGAIERLHRDELGHWHLQLRQRDEQLPVSHAFRERFRGM